MMPAQGAHGGGGFAASFSAPAPPTQQFLPPPPAPLRPPPVGALPGLVPPPPPMMSSLPPGGPPGGSPRSFAPPGASPLLPPPTFGPPGGVGPPQMGVPGQHSGGVDSVVEGMGSLSLGTGAGEAPDATAFPRPGPDVPTPPLPGSCDPAFMRLTTGCLPATAALRARFALPLAVLLHPLSPDAPPPPVANHGGASIVRCRRCRTYINPFCGFTDAGRRWRCNCCANLNDVQPEYFCALDANGRRRDTDERPELCCGSVEYVAPAEYMVRPPMPPVYFFVFDVSAAAVACGYLQRAITAVRESLDALPGAASGRTQVGLLAFDGSLHFFALRAGASQPHIHTVSDVADPFVPVHDDLLCNLAECRPLFEAALDVLPSVATASAAAGASGESALGPALASALSVMQHVGGKMCLFVAQLPTLGDGKLRQREDGRLFGTEREHALRNPEDGWYKKIAAELSRVQVCVDLFVLGGPFLDVAAISTLPKYTGGQLYHLPGYSDVVDGERLAADLRRNLTRDTVWEAVMRVRCSKGFRVAAFHGHFFVRSTDLLALPACDPDKGYAIQLAHEESLAPQGVTYLQCALLHTSSDGERRIRVHTLAASVTESLPDVFRSIDGGAMAAMLAKLAVERSLAGRLEEARASLATKLATSFREYRSLFPSASRSFGKLVFPEPAALLPLYCLAATKSPALRGGFKDVPTDARAAAAFDAIALPAPRLLKLLYPTAYALHLWDGTDGTVPPLVPLSGERIDARGWYIFNDGQKLLLWVGASAPEGAVRDIFGLGHASEVAAAAAAGRMVLRQVSPNEPPAGAASCAAKLVASLRESSPWAFLPLHCAVQGIPGDAALFPLLVEDRSPGNLSYGEQLLSLHRAVQTAPPRG